MPAPEDDLPRRRRSPGWLPAAGVGLVALGLVGGGIALVTGGPSRPAAAVPSATGGGPTSSAPNIPAATAAGSTVPAAQQGTTGTGAPGSSTARPSSAPPIVLTEVPGPGTVAGAKQHLLDLGFTCSEEGQRGMASWLCTRYSSNPTISAYLGGADGKRLGRLSITVQDGDARPSATALDLQRWAARQVLAPAQADRAVAALTSGTDQTLAHTTIDGVNLRGAGDGTFVAYVDGWVPDAVMPVAPLESEPLLPALAQHGYTCQGTGSVTCQADGDGGRRSLSLLLDGNQVRYLGLTLTTTQGAPAAPAAREASWLMGELQDGDQLQAWFDRHRHAPSGATGFADSVVVDWSPGGDQPGTATFALRESCWNDGVENC